MTCVHRQVRSHPRPRAHPHSTVDQAEDAIPFESAFPVRVVRRNLLRWFDRHRRDLPWRRRADDGYAQWVAEIMLQQTRVETVIPYYERFLAAFPTVAALAAADEQSVLKLWEGLGYYRRARLLHRAARQRAAEGGELPRSAQTWRQLPGVGEYTAAAIASITEGEAVAAIDGNVARVVARLIGLHADVLSASGRRTVRQAAGALLSRRRPGDFNQAWMDLGSSVCTPRAPRCERCPLSRCCAAYARGVTAELPRRGTGRTRSLPVVRCVAVVIRDPQGRVLVRRRADDGLWSGLWEFPSSEIAPGARAVETARALLDAAGVAAQTCMPRGTVEHRLSHRLVRFDVFAASVKRRRAPTGVDAPHRWVNRTELAALAMSTAQRNVEHLVRGYETGSDAQPPARRRAGTRNHRTFRDPRGATPGTRRRLALPRT